MFILEIVVVFWGFFSGEGSLLQQIIIIITRMTTPIEAAIIPIIAPVDIELDDLLLLIGEILSVFELSVVGGIILSVGKMHS